MRKLADITANEFPGFKGHLKRICGLSFNYPKMEITSLSSIVFMRTSEGVESTYPGDIVERLRVDNYLDDIEAATHYMTVQVKNNPDGSFHGFNKVSVKDIKAVMASNEWKVIKEEFYSPTTILELINRQIRANSLNAAAYKFLSNPYSFPYEAYSDQSARLVESPSFNSYAVRQQNLTSRKHLFSDLIFAHFLRDEDDQFYWVKSGSKVPTPLMLRGDGVDKTTVPAYILDALEEDLRKYTQIMADHMEGMNKQKLAEEFEKLAEEGYVDKLFIDFLHIDVEWLSYAQTRSGGNKLRVSSIRVQENERRDKEGKVMSNIGLTTFGNSIVFNLFKYSPLIRLTQVVLPFTNNAETWARSYLPVPELLQFQADVSSDRAYETSLRAAVWAEMTGKAPFSHSHMIIPLAKENQNHYWRFLYAFGNAMSASSTAPFATLLCGCSASCKTWIIENLLAGVIQQRYIGSMKFNEDIDQLARQGFGEDRVMFFDEVGSELFNSETGKQIISGGQLKVKKLYSQSMKTIQSGFVKIFATSNGSRKGDRVVLPKWENQRRCLPIMMTNVFPDNLKISEEDVRKTLHVEIPVLAMCAWTYYKLTKLRTATQEMFIGTIEAEHSYLDHPDAVSRPQSFVDEMNSYVEGANYIEIQNSGEEEKAEGIGITLRKIFKFSADIQDKVKTGDIVDAINVYIKANAIGHGFQHAYLNPFSSDPITFMRTSVWLPIRDQLKLCGAINRRSAKGVTWTGISINKEYSGAEDGAEF